MGAISAAVIGVHRQEKTNTDAKTSLFVPGTWGDGYGGGHPADGDPTLDHPALAKPILQCNVANSEKVDCGYHGIPQAECTNKGCCYQELNVAGPWCFKGKGPAGPAVPPSKVSAMCNKPSNDKQDCGYTGITKVRCLAKGCCFHAITGSPYCYYGF